MTDKEVFQDLLGRGMLRTVLGIVEKKFKVGIKEYEVLGFYEFREFRGNLL